jgi:hypothetical protein
MDLDPILPEASLLMSCTYLWMEKKHEKTEDVINRLPALS